MEVREFTFQVEYMGPVLELNSGLKQSQLCHQHPVCVVAQLHAVVQRTENAACKAADSSPPSSFELSHLQLWSVYKVRGSNPEI